MRKSARLKHEEVGATVASLVRLSAHAHAICAVDVSLFLRDKPFMHSQPARLPFFRSQRKDASNSIVGPNFTASQKPAHVPADDASTP
jgi:hypothetical protein